MSSSVGTGVGAGFGFGVGCIVGVIGFFAISGLIAFLVFSVALGGSGDLRDHCAKGDYAACDQLYLQSPVGSEDERFGDTCGDRIPPGARQPCRVINPPVERDIFSQ